MDPRASGAIVALENENAKLRAESEMFQEMAGKATKQLLDANLQNGEMRNEISLLMEYIYATEFWNIEPHDQKERMAHLSKISKAGFSLRRFGTEKQKSERSPYAPNLDYPSKPVTEKLVGERDSVCCVCGTHGPLHLPCSKCGVGIQKRICESCKGPREADRLVLCRKCEVEVGKALDEKRKGEMT
jgi:hypothetical protein